MSAAMIVDVTNSSFEDVVLKSQVPVLVDFWAEKCVPCKAIGMYLDDLATEFEGRVKVTKVNIDTNSAVAAQHGVRGVPALLIFKDGTLKAKRLGGLSKAQLAAFLDSNI